jgi:hypothetical protein
MEHEGSSRHSFLTCAILIQPTISLKPTAIVCFSPIYVLEVPLSFSFSGQNPDSISPPSHASNTSNASKTSNTSNASNTSRPSHPT